MSGESSATDTESLTLSQNLQSLDEAFQNFEKNPPKPSEDSKAKEDFTTKIADIETRINAVKKQIGTTNLDAQTDENKKIKEARQKLYATLDKTSKILNPMVTNKENDEIQKILDLIPSVKASILTAPQIDNPIRHGVATVFSYEYLLASYNDSDISYKPTPPTKRIKIGESKYVHSIFSEEIIRETDKVYQIRENLASCKISLGYIHLGKIIDVSVPHYIGDETTIPSDLQTMFKYVFWFQQKFRTCDVPFFPSVLTMMKMVIAEKFDDFTFLFDEQTTRAATAATTGNANITLTTEQLIKWIKYLEYYFDDCIKKIDTLPSIPVVDKELNDLKNKMMEQYKSIIGWSSTTYTKLYNSLNDFELNPAQELLNNVINALKKTKETEIVAQKAETEAKQAETEAKQAAVKQAAVKQAQGNAAAERTKANNAKAEAETAIQQLKTAEDGTPQIKALTQFLKIIFFYKTHVKEQSDILFGIILDDEVRTVPLTDVEIIQNNLKKMTVCLDKYTTTEQIFGIFEPKST